MTDMTYDILAERSHIAERLAAGEDRQAIHAELVEGFKATDESGSDLNDVYATLLDFLDGWCAPHMRL